MQQIGPYRLVEELGRGGAAVVFRALSPRGEQCAIKVLHRSDGLAKQRFLREAQVLSELSHPALVSLRSVAEHEGRLYLVMPFYVGRRLADRVDTEGPFDPGAAIELVESLADGLAYVHDHGVLHRDIKPDNVLLDLQGTARLTDFGLARRTDSSEPRLSQSGALMGTPGFWAPEQAGSGDPVGPRTDVYGLGATLYYMLTGEPPIAGRTLIEVMRAVSEDSVVPPSRHVPEVGPELDRLCLRCLAKRPRDRFASAHELREALGALRRGPAPRRGRRVGVALGLLALVGIGTVAWFASTRGAAPTAAVGKPGLSAEEGSALEQARASLAAGEPREALAQLGDLAKSTSTEAWGLRSDALIALGDLGGAELALEAALALESSSAELHLRRARLRVDRQRPRQALQSLSEAISLGAGAEAELLRVDVRVSLGDHATAVRDLERITLRNPGLREAWERLADLTRGQPGQRLEVLDRALSALPDDERFLRARGSEHLLQRNLVDAARDFDRLIAHGNAQHSDYAKRSLTRRYRDDLQGALEDAQRAAVLGPQSAPAWRELGLASFGLRRPLVSRHVLTHAYALDPSDLDTLFALAQVCGALGDTAWCARLVEAGLAVRAASASGPYTLLGEAYIDLERFAEAEAAFSQALRFDHSDRGHTRGRRGVVLVQLERDAEAIPDLLAAARAEPDEQQWWAYLGAAYSNVDQPQEGLNAILRSLELGRVRDTEVLEGLVKVYMRLERYEDGYRTLRELAESSPDDPNLHFELTRVCLELKRFEEGLTAAKRLCELDPTSVFGRKMHARFAYELDDLEGCLAVLDAAIATFPERPRLRLLQIDYLSNAGQRERTLPLVNTYLELVPNDAVVLGNRAAMRFDAEDNEGALRDLNRAIKLEPRDPFLRFNRAMLHLRCERFVLSLVDVWHVLDQNPDDVDAWFLRAQSLYYLGRRDEAYAVTQSLLQGEVSELQREGLQEFLHLALGR